MQRNYILQNSVLAFDTNCCFKKLEIPNSGQCVLHLVEVVGGKWWPSLVGWWRTHTPLCSLPTQPAPTRPATPCEVLKDEEDHLLGGGTQAHY